MNIILATFENEENTMIRVITDDVKLSVPVNAENRFYNKLSKWVDDGGKIEAYVQPELPTTEETYNQKLNDNAVLKAVVIALNDGSFIPGSNYTKSGMKIIIKAKM